MNKLITFIILIALSLPHAIATPSNGTVTRSFSASTMGQSETLTVTLTPNIAQGFYQIHEIIPEGFTFESTNSDNVSVSGRDIIFTKMTGTSLNYTLTSPVTTGTFTFNGTFIDNDRNEGIINGLTQVTISAIIRVTRELSNNYTYLENTTDNIVVTLKTTETGFTIYGIVENIPEDVTISLIDHNNINMTIDDNNYTFITINKNTNPILLRYAINTTHNSNIGNHTIRGYYKNSPDNTVPLQDSTFRIVSTLFQLYDINNDNRLQKSEILNAAWDYFSVPSKISMNDIAGLIKQYLLL